MKKEGQNHRLNHNARTKRIDRERTPYFDSEKKAKPHADCLFIASTGEFVKYQQCAESGGQIVFIPDLRQGISEQAFSEWTLSMAKRNRTASKKQKDLKKRDGARRYSKKQKMIDLRRAREALKIKRANEEAEFGWNHKATA